MREEEEGRALEPPTEELEVVPPTVAAKEEESEVVPLTGEEKEEGW